ncbi:hypothetical protein ES703_55810 [subsurface metagenome]
MLEKAKEIGGRARVIDINVLSVGTNLLFITAIIPPEGKIVFVPSFKNAHEVPGFMKLIDLLISFKEAPRALFGPNLTG